MEGSAKRHGAREKMSCLLHPSRRAWLTDLSECRSGLVNHLLGIGDHFIAAAEHAEQLVNVVDTASTAFQQVKDAGALTGGSVTERQDTVTTVRVERTEDTDTRVTLVTVETDWFIEVRSTLYLLLNLGVEHRVIARYLTRKHTLSMLFFIYYAISYGE